MNKHESFPFEYETLAEYSPEHHAYGDVTFTEDFGPYKKGEYIFSLWIEFESMTVQFYESASAAKPKHSLKFKFVLC
jgi:hypothetical protein